MPLSVKICLSLLLPLLCSSFAIGQDNFGALNGNYTPTNSLYLNPSSISSSKVWLDLNIAGIGFYSNNDLVYLDKQKWISTLKKIGKKESKLSDLDLGFNSGKEEYQGYNRNFVSGFSGVWSQQNHGVGLSTGVRSYTDVRGISSLAAFFLENESLPDNLDTDTTYNVGGLRLNSMHFGEIKATYSYTFLKGKRSVLSGGVSISKFFPIAGAGYTVQELNFRLEPENSNLEYNLESESMYTPKAKLRSNGGYGFDLGFSFQSMMGGERKNHKNSWGMGCQKDLYRYKIGVSIIDVGYVKFPEDEVHAENYAIDDWIEAESIDEISSVNLLNELEQHEANTTEGKIQKPNRMSLPTFVSVQFDYNVWDSKFYINGTWIHGLTNSSDKFAVRHAHSLSIVPRYETFLFEFAIPISLYEYEQPQLGLSARFGPITLGTDNLLNWLKTKKIYGADFYVYTKIPLRYRPKCKVGFKPREFIRKTKRPKLLN